MRDAIRLATARLTVRPVTGADADAVHRIRGQMPFDPQTRSLDQTRAMIAGITALAPGAPGWRQYAVERGGVVIGDVGVNFDEPSPGNCEIGFALDAAAREQGLGTEAVGAMVAALFTQGLHRIHARTDARNLPTKRLLTRLGFRREAHHVRSWRDGDAWFDEFGYALLHDDPGRLG